MENRLFEENFCKNLKLSIQRELLLTLIFYDMIGLNNVFYKNIISYL